MLFSREACPSCDTYTVRAGPPRIPSTAASNGAFCLQAVASPTRFPADPPLKRHPPASEGYPMNSAIHRITRRSTSEAAGEKCHRAQIWFTAEAKRSPRTAAWFPPELIYPKKRGLRHSVEFAKTLLSTSCKIASIG